jgi:hypothetical protein
MTIKDILTYVGICEYMTHFSSPSSFDSKQFKIAQCQSWDSAALAWKEWLETLEVVAYKVNDRMIELAEIKPGQKVLDIAISNTESSNNSSKEISRAS